MTGPLPERLLAPAGFRIGVGPEVTASEAPRSWEGAVRALRFAGTSRSDVGLAPVVEEPAIYHSSLGAFEVLAGNCPARPSQTSATWPSWTRSPPSRAAVRSC